MPPSPATADDILEKLRPPNSPCALSSGTKFVDFDLERSNQGKPLPLKHVLTFQGHRRSSAMSPNDFSH